MAVTRIVANLFSNDPIALAKFYADVFGLELPLDMGWISFLTNDHTKRSSFTQLLRVALERNCQSFRSALMTWMPPKRQSGNPELRSSTAR